MNSELVKIKRSLKMSLPKGQSAFLWGPRQTGKTTLLEQKYPKSLRYDLLKSDLFLRLSKEPHRLREEILALGKSLKTQQPVIIDEVQKIPTLLDEVHWLIENEKLQFVLCGSSARKLKRSHANMLGGRAWRFELYPLTTQELGKSFDLIKALNRGLVPSHYLSSQYGRAHRAYVQDYLKEEIQQEGLVRNLPAFARFLDSMAFSNGELVNYSNVARDCGVDSKTVAEYYQILVDTLLGNFLQPYRKQKKRITISSTPKFYLFDVGVAGALIKRRLATTQGFEFGKALEHLVWMELKAYAAYSEQDIDFSFWRTKDGLEVDFILNRGQIALEVKATMRVDTKDLKGLKAFKEEHQPKQSILVCQESTARQLESGILVLPLEKFFKRLWSGEIF